MSARIHPFDLRSPRLYLPILTTLALLPCTGVIGEYNVYLLALAFIYAITATGLILFVGYTGQLSLGQAAFFGIGAYSAANATRQGAPLLIAVILGSAVAALAAFLLGFAALRLRGFYLAVTTLAFGLIAYQVFGNLEHLTGGVSGLGHIPMAHLGSLAIKTPLAFYLLNLIALAVSTVGALALVKSPAGSMMRAISGSELAAQSVGINAYLVKTTVFAIAGAYAGFSGGLFAHLNRYIAPDDFGLILSISFLVMATLGGLQSVFGGILGALAVTFAVDAMRVVPKAEPILFGLALLLLVRYLPSGIAGVLIKPSLARPLSSAPIRHSDDKARTRRPGREWRGTRVLEVRNLEKRFGGLVALAGVSLVIPRGAIFGIIGPNGAGKTTLFNVISGIESPQHGQVFLQDEEITGFSMPRIARKGLARTFQRSLPFASMTTLENLLVAGYASDDAEVGNVTSRWLGIGAGLGAIQARAHELLALAGLERMADRMAETMSHGDLRRLEVARALMIRPRVLLLDEPAAGLSADELRKITALLRTVRDGDTTIVIIEHNMTLMMSVCDRIAVLDHGAKIAEGTPAEIQNHEAVVEAYFGRENRHA
jgi:ABC-type branched-subunit amino acid transport system ATPase component/ABC-type branched-subunit amino acid transport system permease subunit